MSDNLLISTKATRAKSSPQVLNTSSYIAPSIVGLFVIILLLWMIIRYAISNKATHLDDVYCCPQSVFDFFGNLCSKKTAAPKKNRENLHNNYFLK